MTEMFWFQLNVVLGIFTLTLLLEKSRFPLHFETFKFSMIVNAANFSDCFFGHDINCNLIFFDERRLRITRQQLLWQLVFEMQSSGFWES